MKKIKIFFKPKLTMATTLGSLRWLIQAIQGDSNDFYFNEIKIYF